MNQDKVLYPKRQCILPYLHTPHVWSAVSALGQSTYQCKGRPNEERIDAAILGKLGSESEEEEGDFLAELSAHLTVNSMRTIRFALEQYYEIVRGTTSIPDELPEMGSLKDQEDAAYSLVILQSIVETHYHIKYLANKHGVDC